MRVLPGLTSVSPEARGPEPPAPNARAYRGPLSHLLPDDLTAAAFAAREAASLTAAWLRSLASLRLQPLLALI